MAVSQKSLAAARARREAPQKRGRRGSCTRVDAPGRSFALADQRPGKRGRALPAHVPLEPLPLPISPPLLRPVRYAYRSRLPAPALRRRGLKIPRAFKRGALACDNILYAYLVGVIGR